MIFDKKSNKQLKENIKKMIRLVESLEDDIKNGTEESNMYYDEEQIEKLKENLKEMIRLAESLDNTAKYGTVDSLYNDIARIEALILDSYVKNKMLMVRKSKERSIEYDGKNYEEYVEFFEVSENCIHFRIPLLNNRYGYKNKKLFSNIICYAFLSLIDKGINVPQMKEHTILFTFVYPTSYRKRIPDNDNYDTREIINDIVFFIGSSDSGVNSWQEYAAVMSDELKSGTYIKIIRRNPEC